MDKKKTRVNGAIRARELRVVDADGNQIGVITREDALERAQLAGLDLVELSPHANPPVAKILDWGKYKYQKTKEAQKSRSKAKAPDLKQIRCGLKIGDHDLEVKVSKIRKFIEAGHKVKVAAFFRGRELAHKEIGYKLLERIMEMVEDIAVVDQEPQFAGKHLSMTIRKR